MSKIYLGNALHIVFECGIDVTTASTKQIKVLKPDLTVATLTATATGTTGLMADTTADQVGEHLAQARAVIGSATYLGETVRYEVFPAYG